MRCSDFDVADLGRDGGAAVRLTLDGWVMRRFYPLVTTRSIDSAARLLG